MPIIPPLRSLKQTRLHSEMLAQNKKQSKKYTKYSNDLKKKKTSLDPGIVSPLWPGCLSSVL
jgi:hypothetical protein